MSQPSDCSRLSYVTYTILKMYTRKVARRMKTHEKFVILKLFFFSLQWQKCAEPEVRAAKSP